MDDRSDADDDLNKGKIRFPKAKLYGREDELEHLQMVYEAVVVQSDEFHKEAAAPSSSSAVPSQAGDAENGKDGAEQNGTVVNKSSNTRDSLRIITERTPPNLNSES